MDEFSRLKDNNIEIAKKIQIANERQEHDLVIELKKELYSNKLRMLELLTIDKKRSLTITATELKNEVKQMKPAIRYETGLYWLDNELVDYRNIKGLEVGSLILMAGSSYSGKTTTTMKILSNISRYAKTMLFSLEMGKRRVNHKLSKLLDSEVQYNNFMLNFVSRDLEDIIMEIVLAAQDGVVFFAIDSRMKITSKKNLQDHQLASLITQRLSQIATENDIIIILINQISESDLREKRLSFKGSGDQMYDADYAFFIIVDEETEQRTLVCKKNRADERVFAVDMPNTQPVEIVYEEVKSDEVKDEEVSMPLL